MFGCAFAEGRLQCALDKIAVLFVVRIAVAQALQGLLAFVEMGFVLPIGHFAVKFRQGHGFTIQFF